MNMSTQPVRMYEYQKRYVTEGNTVRVVHTEEEPYYEEELKRRLAKERRLQKKKQKVVHRDRKKQFSVQLPALIVLCIGVAAMLYFGYLYLSLQSSVDTHTATISRLETNLESMKVENDALEQSIETNLDMDYVYDVAVHKLGMVHAGAENIMQYEKTESEYVRQYEQIPTF